MEHEGLTKARRLAGEGAREIEVLRPAARGLPAKQIEAEFSISYYTAANHLRHIYEKTGVRSRVELAGYAVRRHLAPLAGQPRM